MESAASRIAGRIEAMPDGEAFTAGDFLDLASQPSANTELHRLERRGMVERALRGVYAKPRRSGLLGVTAPPSPDAVARAIARANRWAIAPAGDTALNLLGLDEQVPARVEYVSSGPYKTYAYGNGEIRFRHRASRDLVECSPTTMLVTQALRALGREGADGDVMRKVSERLTDDEVRALYDETRNSTAWVFGFAKELREERGI